jgi:predicted PurR-regulated permease PerM
MDSSALNAVEATWEIIRRLTRRALVLALVVAVGYVLYRIRSVVASVFLAVILTYVLLPGVEWLCRKRSSRLRPKTHRLIATIMVFCVFLAALAAMISLFVVPFSAELGDFADLVGKHLGKLAGPLTRIVKAFQENVDVKEFINRPDWSRYGDLITRFGNWLLQFAGSSVRVVLELVLVPVLAFYFTFDYRSITREFYGLFPASKRRDAVRMGRIAGEMMQSYIFGQLILCLIAGLLTGAFLSMLGMRYVVVLALFAGITRAIPIIGPVVSGIPIVLVGALTFPDRIEVPIYLLLFVVFMHFAESKFIMPQVIGHRLRLNPAVVIIVLLIGAEFFGIAGMFLAAPVAAICREILRRYYVRPRERRAAAQSAS